MTNPSLLEFKNETKPIWCPGCGHFTVLNGLKRSMVNLALQPKDIVLVSGIGCSSRLPDYVNTYGFHGAHGRALPVATGVKVANPELNVVVMGGDGDGLSIGVGHFVHTARRNPDITYILMNNSLYAMTKGQYSPCSTMGTISGTSPYGNTESEISPIALALTLGVSFVARGSSANLKELTGIIEEGIQHKGFSFIEVISPCVTFGKKDQYDTLKQLSSPIEGKNAVDSRRKAMSLALSKEKAFTGIFFRETKPCINEDLDGISHTALQNKNTIESIWNQFK